MTEKYEPQETRVSGGLVGSIRLMARKHESLLVVLGVLGLIVGVTLLTIVFGPNILLYGGGSIILFRIVTGIVAEAVKMDKEKNAAQEKWESEQDSKITYYH